MESVSVNDSKLKGKICPMEANPPIKNVSTLNVGGAGPSGRFSSGVCV